MHWKTHACERTNMLVHGETSLYRSICWVKHIHAVYMFDCFLCVSFCVLVLLPMFLRVRACPCVRPCAFFLLLTHVHTCLLFLLCYFYIRLLITFFVSLYLSVCLTACLSLLAGIPRLEDSNPDRSLTRPTRGPRAIANRHPLYLHKDYVLCDGTFP